MDVAETRLLWGLSRAATTLACSGPLQQVLDSVASDAMTAMQAGACSLVFFDAGSHTTYQVGTAGHLPGYARDLSQAIRDGAPVAAARAFTERRLVVLDDLQQHRTDPRWTALERHLAAGRWDRLLSTPLMQDGQCLAVVSGFFEHPAQAHPGIESFMLILADHIALAVANARLIVESRALTALRERHEFARDLHDSAVQTAFSLSMQARAARVALERQAPSATAADAVAELTRIEAMSEDLQREMRALIAHLAPSGTGDLVARLSVYAQEIERTSGVSVVVVNTGLLGGDFLAHRSEEVFRIVREAINNSVKHASAGTVEVHLRKAWRSTRVEIAVSDDGCGFDGAPPDAGHGGLASMIDRAERLGGRLHLTTSAAGTLVLLTVPVDDAAPDCPSAQDG